MKNVKAIVLPIAYILAVIGAATIGRVVGYQYGLLGVAVLFGLIYLIKFTVRTNPDGKLFLTKRQELIIYALMIGGAYTLYFAVGENAGSTFMGIAGAIGVFVLGLRVSFKRVIGKSTRHNERLARLETKPSWRFAKAVYFGIALLFVVIGIFAALADTYYEHQTGYVAWLGILQAVLYPIFWRVAYYVSFGKPELLTREAVSVDAIARESEDGKLIATMPATLLDSTLFADKELRLHPVSKLAYDFDSGTYTKIMDKFKVNTQYRLKLEKLIELNSGYLTTDLIEDEFGINNEVSTKLLSELISHKQAAKAPSSRKLYRLSA